MKKLKITFFALAAMLVASCGSKTATTSDSDSVAVDTTTVVAEPEAPKTVVPTEVLTLEVKSKKLKHVPASSYVKGTMGLEVKNNSHVAVCGDSYQIGYVAVTEDEINGMFEIVNHKMTTPGVDVEPNSTAEIVLKSTVGCQDLKSPKIVDAAE